MNYKEFLIKKGHHRSGIHFAPQYDQKFIHFQSLFRTNCLYDLEGPDQLDINKLYGVSFGLHHNNSARFGWRSTLNGKIELFAYCYINKQRVTHLLGEVDTNVLYNFKLLINENNYIFKVYKSGQLLYNVTIAKNTTKKLGYFLYPFFGGNRTAPNNVGILFRKINSKSFTES